MYEATIRSEGSRIGAGKPPAIQRSVNRAVTTLAILWNYLPLLSLILKSPGPRSSVRQPLLPAVSVVRRRLIVDASGPFTCKIIGKLRSSCFAAVGVGQSLPVTGRRRTECRPSRRGWAVWLTRVRSQRQSTARLPGLAVSTPRTALRTPQRVFHIVQRPRKLYTWGQCPRQILHCRALRHPPLLQSKADARPNRQHTCASSGHRSSGAPFPAACSHPASFPPTAQALLQGPCTVNIGAWPLVQPSRSR